MSFAKPARIKLGDTVAVLSPSWGGPSLYPGVFDLGLRNLEICLGVRIKEFPTARMADETLYQNPQVRAEDINAAFADPEITAIFSSIGGDDSVRILPFLDMETILNNPKVFMGYSDTVTMLSYLNWNGMVTYNGPSIMAGFAQMRHLPPAFSDHLRAMLAEPTDSLDYRPYEQWTDHYVSWGTPGYDGEVQPVADNSEGWHWLQGQGAVSGHLFGGCIEVYEFLKGTQFWPPADFFDGKILFFETSEDKPSVTNVKYMLRNYGSMGVLDRIVGILFGRARSYSDAEKHELEQTLVQVVAGEFGRDDLPIVANMDFGHTDPQLIMPLGVEVEIDCVGRRIRLQESPVA